MNTNLLKAQLLALSSQLEALSGQVAAMFEAIEPSGCSHDNKQDISTIGSPPAYSCPDCGREWTEEQQEA